MDLKKLQGQFQTEVDTTFLYESIASIQSDENLTRVLQSLAKSIYDFGWEKRNFIEYWE